MSKTSKTTRREEYGPENRQCSIENCSEITIKKPPARYPYTANCSQAGISFQKPLILIQCHQYNKITVLLPYVKISRRELPDFNVDRRRILNSDDCLTYNIRACTRSYLDVLCTRYISREFVILRTAFRRLIKNSWIGFVSSSYRRGK